VKLFVDTIVALIILEAKFWSSDGFTGHIGFHFFKKKTHISFRGRLTKMGIKKANSSLAFGLFWGKAQTLPAH